MSMETSPGTGINLHLLEVAKFGPPIFPILFAGIFGSTLRLAARWRAEKGSTIEVIIHFPTSTPKTASTC
jgi:hypothetical protein